MANQILSDVERTLAGDGRILLAVSGGVDSMVMLDAAARVVDRRRLTAATFDHRTGSASHVATQLVADRSAALGVPCVIGRAPDGLAGTEAAWRERRWAFLRATAGSRPIATAHTRDDQIETVFLRELRGSGPRGLAGLYARSDVLRPLLYRSRMEVEDYAAEHGVEFVVDPSNQSAVYARNRARRDLLPAIRASHPGFDDGLLTIATRAAEWRAEVDAATSRFLRVERHGSHGLDVAAAPLGELSSSELSVVWPSLAARVGLALDRRGIARLADFSAHARVGSHMQLSGGWIVCRSRDAFELRAVSEKYARRIRVEFPCGAVAAWDEWALRPAAAWTIDDPWTAPLPREAPLSVRGWLPGDAMPPAAGRSPKKVKRLLSDAGITGHHRTNWPVVLAGDTIIWIPGVRLHPILHHPPSTTRHPLPYRCERHL